MICSLQLSSKHESRTENAQDLGVQVSGDITIHDMTRPDMEYNVNKACHFMHCPLETHLKEAKWILRYIQGPMDYGITLRESRHLSLVGDGDWRTDLNDRRSTIGYCIYLGSNIVSWVSKKQTTVSRSILKAEYRSLANAMAQVVWLHQCLTS